MQMGSPGIPVVTIRQSSDGVLRNRDSVSGDDGYFYISASIAGVVAEYGHMQFVNPVGSGVIALIDEFHFNAPTLGGYNVSAYDTLLVNDAGVWRSNNPAAVNGVCKMYMGTNAGRLGTLIYTIYNRVDGSIHQPLKFPLVVLEGEGIVIVHYTVNENTRGYFAGREI